MSKIGKKPIIVPKSIKVEVNSNIVKISKDKIVREYNFGDKVSIEFKDDKIFVTPKKEFDKKEISNFFGLHRSNIANIVKGLDKPFQVILEINGVGFKACVLKGILYLTLGYSHDIAFALPSEVTAKVEENRIVLESIDKELVGRVGAKIISLRKPEPYKGKGVKIYNKPILRKEGKKK